MMEERKGFPMDSEPEAPLQEALDRIARSRVREDVDLWPALQARLFTTPARRIRFGGRRAWAWGLAGLALVLALAGMAWARYLWEAFPFIGPLERAGKARPLAQSQRQDGITVTLERAYVDANRVLIGYRVRGLPESADTVWLPEFTLEDTAGHPLPPLIRTSLAGASEGSGLPLLPGEMAGVIEFDPWALPDWPARLPETLALRMQVTLRALPTVASAPGLLRVEIAPEAGPAGGASETSALPPPALPTPRAVHTFQFDVTVPVVREVIVYGPQTATARGLTLALERWVETPSGTRARVCFRPPDPRLRWTLAAEQRFKESEATAEGERSSQTTQIGVASLIQLTITPNEGHVCQDLFFDLSSSGRTRPRPTALYVLELVGFPQSGTPEPVRWPGPWVFPLPLEDR